MESAVTGHRDMRAGRSHAVVLGASMAGLLAARVLSESFAKVTVIERDDLSSPGDRRGVPQGRHVHALLARGTRIFEELFPGLTQDLLAEGAVECRALSEMRMSLGGHTLRQSDSGYTVLQASRPFLEWRVRERVRGLPNVDVLDGRTVEALCYDRAAERVRGVRVAGVGEIEADLIVSCLGRHGPVNDWLADLGYDRPAEEGVRIDMMYASRYVRLPVGAVRGDKEIIVSNQQPARGLALFAVEDGKHILTLIGYGNDHPPADSDGFWRFASSVAPPDVRQALVEAESLTDIATYRYLANQRRRYERLARFPDGLLVFGDAVCSFSPAFGQGMTVSALQAVRLRAVLAGGDHDLPRRYFRAAATAIDDAWLITKLFDLAMPHVDASGQVLTRSAGSLVGLGLAAGARDARVGRAIARIAGLLDRPTAVLRPQLLAHTATALGRVGIDQVRQATARSAGRTSAFDPLPHGPAMGFHRLAVRSVTRDTRDSAIVEFDVPAELADRFRYAAGQHIVVRGTRHGEAIRRSYSLCDPAGSGRLRIAVKRQDGGAFSSYVLDHRIVGSALYVSEPTGMFTPGMDSTARCAYAAVAAGSGITPIVSIIGTVLESEPHSTFTLYYGSRGLDDVMLDGPLRALVDRFPRRLRVTHHFSRHSERALPEPVSGVTYRRGRIDPATLTDDVDRWFLCGPRELVSRTVASLTERGLDRSRILLELFDTDTVNSPPPETDAPTSRVTLTGHGRPMEFDMPRDRSILEAALGQREDLPYSCLGGSCGTCRAAVESGEVAMDPDPLLAITDHETASGYVLACRTRPVSDNVVLRFE
ncbi:2Fe-2S iron-sulfur cluster-binding protein [Nocardia sp. NPDC055029]